MHARQGNKGQLRLIHKQVINIVLNLNTFGTTDSTSLLTFIAAHSSDLQGFVLPFPTSSLVANKPQSERTFARMSSASFHVLVVFAEAPAAWTTLEDKAEWSGSDSSSPFSGTGADEGLGSPLPLHLTEDQLPFSIGISETSLYGCQYCEKSFPRPSYLRVHEKV